MVEVSVIIPTCNRPEFLKKAIESVYNQSLLPKEIIVVDDSSITDNLSIIKAFNKEKIKCHYFKFKKSMGACAARNKGAELAKGDILMFLDDDDTWERDKIKLQMRIFETNPNVGLVYSGRLIVSNKNRNKILRKIPPKASGYIYPQIFYVNLIGPTSSVAIKKDIFVKAGGFDVSFPALQDYDLWIRICKLTKVAHDNSCSIRYTVFDNNKQISGQVNRQLKAIQLFLEKYAEEIDKLGFIGRRKVIAQRYLSLARSVHRHSYLNALKWTIKGFLTFPKPQFIFLTIPYLLKRILQNSLFATYKNERP